MVSKVFEKLVDNRLVDNLQKYVLFSNFQCGFWSSRSTADILTVASGKIPRAFNRSGATPAVVLDISKAFDRIWHAGLPNISLIEFQVRFLVLFHLFSVICLLGVVLNGKSSQEYPLNAGISQGSILGPIVCIGVSTSLKDTMPFFFAKPPP